MLKTNDKNTLHVDVEVEKRGSLIFACVSHLDKTGTELSRKDARENSIARLFFQWVVAAIILLMHKTV